MLDSFCRLITIMAMSSRPSLDVLVPLVMIENTITNDINDNLSCEPQKGWNDFYFDD